MDRVISICKEMGIDVVLLDSNIYKNITVMKSVNIDRLKREIGNCYLLVSDDVDEVKIDNCYYESIAKVYYILTDLRDRKNMQEYYDKAEEEYGEVLVSVSESSTTELESMSTLYTAEEENG